MDVSFESVWQGKDSSQAAEAKAFWEAHGLLPPQLREQRALELVALARDGDTVVGVSTANIDYQPPLRGRFAMFRCAVAPEAPREALSLQLAAETFRILHDWSVENPGEHVLGIMTVLEGGEFGDIARRPIWSDSDEGLQLNLVGYMPDGQQIRVAWFEHARVEIDRVEAPRNTTPNRAI